jgi:hypothetical protein
MHPRERVLGLAELLRQRGEPYTHKLINEAQRLGVDLPTCKIPQNYEETKTKETEHGSSKD